MGIGNDNSDGNRKSNFNDQLRVLQLLTAISDAVGGKVGPTAGNTAYGPIRSTGTTTVPAGAKSISVYNAGSANGQANGQIVKQGERYTWEGYFKTAMTINGGGLTEMVVTYVI